ncbi:MAG: chemotaxis protein MotB [Archangium gephyra]|uniref:Chemotaxis protein MotB n=1 Tax=Archangium gephyra TaxID=48 RepID=A0A2W5TAW4_9BACT|nr:MAG: chemotaxis protein MotB [Archangium gephyra]
MSEAGTSSKLPWFLWVLTLIAALAAGWWAWERVEQLRTSKQELTDSMVEAARLRGACEQSLADAGVQATSLEAQLAELQKSQAELSVLLAQSEAELQRLTATSRSLEDKLAAEIKRGDVKVTQTDGRIQVDLIDKVLFDSAQADISPRGEEVLTRLGAILKDIDDRQIQISGHTDDAPITLPDLKAKFATNWELSTARAVNVVRFLSEKASVKPARLSAAGYGQYKPVATNITPKGRAANRRIEVLLLPPIEARKAVLPAKDAPK